MASHERICALWCPNWPIVARADLKIVEVSAYPTSFPVPPQQRVTLGIGTAVKRDAVVVKVRTAGGLVGWGESHHGRAHTAVAKLIIQVILTTAAHRHGGEDRPCSPPLPPSAPVDGTKGGRGRAANGPPCGMDRPGV